MAQEKWLKTEDDKVVDSWRATAKHCTRYGPPEAARTRGIISYREWPRALDVLGVMARSSIQIDTITCNAAVSACEKGGEWPHALDI